MIKGWWSLKRGQKSGVALVLLFGLAFTISSCVDGPCSDENSLPVIVSIDVALRGGSKTPRDFIPQIEAAVAHLANLELEDLGWGSCPIGFLSPVGALRLDLELTSDVQARPGCFGDLPELEFVEDGLLTTSTGLVADAPANIALRATYEGDQVTSLLIDANTDVTPMTTTEFDMSRCAPASGLRVYAMFSRLNGSLEVESVKVSSELRVAPLLVASWERAE